MIKNILRHLFSVVSVLIILICCGVWLLMGLPNSSWKLMSVATGSMRPTIMPSSVVLMHKVPISTLKIGDVITYKNPFNPKQTITHRIIKKISIDNKVPGFITKGDYNKVPDVPIVAGEVQGKIIWHAPKLGYYMQWSKTWTGLFIFLYIPALLIIFDETLRLSDYYKSFIPYRVKGYIPRELAKRSFARLYLIISLTLSSLAALAYFGPIAEAAMSSNTVGLTSNMITVSQIKSGNNSCGGVVNNDTDVNVNVDNQQNAETGNTTGGGGTTASGNSSNNSASDIKVDIKNC